MSDVNLRTLQELRAEGAPQFFDADQSSIKRRLIAKFEADTNKTLFEGQPEMFMIETMAYSLSVKSSAEQNAVLQNTIVWSQGRHIEDNAANVSIFRLLPQSARTTLRFYRDGDVGEIVTIEKGTRIAASTFEFITDQDITLSQGVAEITVSATAVKPGLASDGLAKFVINTPIDNLPEGIEVHNITISFGGSDIEDLERLRERAANGNFRISKGGPRNGYREIVKGIHPDIVDVSVIKPQPGYIDIYPLMKTGLPSQEIKDLVLSEIDPEEDAPMGDFLNVRDLTRIVYDFILIIYVEAADATVEAQGRNVAVEVFDAWSQLAGVRVAPSTITSEVRKVSGVIDAAIEGLSFTDLNKQQFAALGELTVDVRVRQMREPFIPSTMIPPGANDKRSRALIDAYSQELEQVKLTDLLVNNAMTVDARLLPAMTVARSMSDFVYPNMREIHLRQLLNDYREIHANSGYIKGTRRALSALGVTVSWTQWFEETPKAHHNTHKVTAFINENLFAGDASILNSETQSAVLRFINLTKRWSQDIDFTIGLGSNSKVGLANAAISIRAGYLSGCISPRFPSTSTLGIANAATGIIAHHFFCEVQS